MNFLEFKKSLESGEIHPVYLLEGEDAYFRSLAVNAIKNRFILEPSINSVTFEGDALKDNANFSSFLSSLTSYPFMSEKRMTLVSDYHPNKDAVKSISSLIEDGVTSDSILVINNDKEDENLKKLSNVCVVTCKKSDPFTLSRWIKGTCERDGVSIDLETAKLLAEYCLLDMSRISTETSKLISYAFDKKVITKEDLEELIYRDSEYKIYEMTDYIAKKQIDNALKVISQLIAKGETEQRLLISIYNYFRRLLHVAISSMTEKELAEAFMIKEIAVKKAKEQASKFKITALKKAVDVLEDADFNFKSGKRDIVSEFYLSLFKILLNE